MFKLEDVSKIYRGNGTEVKALDGVSLTIRDQEIVSIVGKSGSGKTTLLNVLSTIDRMTEGKIVYNDISYFELSERKAAELRLNHFGFVFQKYQLMPTLNVYDNILLPGVLAGQAIEKEYCKELLNILDIEEQADRMPNQLSGGQQQRVAIARALLLKPSVVFADEPTGNLDSANSQKVIELLLRCAKQYKQTVIYVTHDEQLAAMADRTIQIKDGVVVA